MQKSYGQKKGNPNVLLPAFIVYTLFVVVQSYGQAIIAGSMGAV